MLSAPLFACVFWCASTPHLGAMTSPPGHGVLHFGAGMNGLFPSLSLAATAGVAEPLDLTLRYDVHGGLAHDVSAIGRLRLADYWAAQLTVGHVFYAIEEIGGIRAADSPFGNGLSTALEAQGSLFAAGGAHIAFGAGLSVRWWSFEEDVSGALSRQADVILEHAVFELAAEWEGDGGTTYLRLRAVVPIQADFRVLGFLPWVTIGTTWEVGG